jgi:hypothetical protein
MSGPGVWGVLPAGGGSQLGALDGAAYLTGAEDYGLGGADFLFGVGSGSRGSLADRSCSLDSEGGSGGGRLDSGSGEPDVDDALDDAFEGFLAGLEGRNMQYGRNEGA